MSPVAVRIRHETAPPSDLLLEVASRLKHAADVVRVHAVCRPWRDASALLSPATTHPTCLPWVLGTCSRLIVHSVVDFRCSFQTPTFRRSHGAVVIEKPRQVTGTDDDTKWVATVDGSAASLFVAHPSPRLVDLLSGAVTRRLPLFPDEDLFRPPTGAFRGVIYGDGPVFLYSFIPESHREDYIPADIDSETVGYMPDFTAAILRPGDAAWTVVKTRLDLAVVHHPCAAYHDGKIWVCMGRFLWCVVTPDFGASGGETGGGVTLVSGLGARASEEDTYYSQVCNNHILVSGGELLWASVVVVRRMGHPCYALLSVMVHALQEEPGGGGGKVRWVVRDGRSLADRVLFLGSPASFAAQWDSGAACAYFVLNSGLLRYNFVDHETSRLVKWLAAGWDNNEAVMWLRPSLAFAPIEKIRERLEAGADPGFEHRGGREDNDHIRDTIHK